MSKELYAIDAAEQVRRWDAGNTIWTIGCAGLGPSYEQAIQVAAVEFTRVCKDLTDLKNDDKESTAKFTAKCEQRLQEIDAELGGLSGAQFGQARWLAWQWCFNGGPKALVERAKDKGEAQRVIQASKFFPSV